MIERIDRSFALRFSAGFCVVGLLLPVKAGADRLQLQGSACQPSNEGVSYTISGIAGIGNNSSAANPYYCPIFHGGASSASDDQGDDFDYKRATSAVVDVVDGNDAASVSAQVCLTYDAGGGSCGSLATTTAGGTGWVSLTPSISTWVNAGTSTDFAFLRVTLPGYDPDNGMRSNILGYRVTSN